MYGSFSMNEGKINTENNTNETNRLLNEINNSLNEIKPKKKKPLPSIVWVILWGFVSICIYFMYIILVKMV